MKEQKPNLSLKLDGAAAGASQLCESPLEPDVCSSEDGCCCELTAEPPSCTCFGTRLYAFSEDSLVRSMAAMYGFSPLCTSVGTSYFARLAARDEVCDLLLPEMPP